MRKLLSSILSAALLVAGWPGAQAFAQNVSRPAVFVPVSGAVAGSAAASAIKPLSHGISVMSAAPIPTLSFNSATEIAPAASLPATAILPAAPELAKNVSKAAADETSTPARSDEDSRAPGALRLAARLADALVEKTNRAAISGSHAHFQSGLATTPPPEEWDKLIEPPAGTPNSLAEVSLEIDPTRHYAPSPEDWRNEALYEIMVDRFARGEGAHPAGDPTDGRTRHGGNLKGIIAQLDYIRDMGITTLLLTPVAMNAQGGYHGYWPIHLLAVDPHYGTMEDFKLLVKGAHERGMHVVLDFVVNHTGPVFEYEDDSRWNGKDSPPKPVRWRQPMRPTELAQPEHFYRHGVIDDWNDTDQITHADFPPNLRHYDAENPPTQDLLIRTAQWWMKETDIDGFRLDAYKHIKPEFWQRFHREVKEYAARLGKDNFLQLGEISSGMEADVAPHVGPGKLDSAFNYPAFRHDDAALHAEQPTSLLEESLKRSLAVFGDMTNWLVRFLDNHDAFRFLGHDVPTDILRTSLAYLFFATGIPMVYYGTEQAFRHIGAMGHYDPGSRGDMFAQGLYKQPGMEGDLHKKDAPLFQWIRRLLDIRKALTPLRKGEQWVRWSSPDGPGLFAFSRIHEGEEVLVVMNTAQQARSADMWVDAGITPPGSRLADELEPNYEARTYASSSGGSKIRVEVPPHGVRVLTRRQP